MRLRNLTMSSRLGILRTLVAWSLLSTSGCIQNDPGFGDDPNSTNDTGVVGACNPSVSNLGFAKGMYDDELFIRVSMNYQLRCGATVDEGSVKIKVTNLDADISKTYYFDTGDDSYVTVMKSSKEVWVDFWIGEDDASTTFQLEASLKDSDGFWSNSETKNVTYIELTDEV